MRKSRYIAEYLMSPHWRKLKEQLIHSNPDAKCWICEKSYNLLLHHLVYDNLWYEELVKIYPFIIIGDVVVVCFDCHTNIHFINIFGVVKIRVPLKRFLLVKHMVFLRLLYLLRRGRYMKFFLSFLYYLF